jgi:hypothetical protein
MIGSEAAARDRQQIRFRTFGHSEFQFDSGPLLLSPLHPEGQGPGCSLLWRGSRALHELLTPRVWEKGAKHSFLAAFGLTKSTPSWDDGGLRPLPRRGSTRKPGVEPLVTKSHSFFSGTTLYAVQTPAWCGEAAQATIQKQRRNS